MASFAHVEGTSFTASERRLFRAGLNVLMVWHAIWALHQSVGLVARSLVAPVTRLYAWTIWLPGLALMVGLVEWSVSGAARATYRRAGAGPLAAIHVWYVAMAIEPGALFVVQIAHRLAVPDVSAAGGDERARVTATGNGGRARSSSRSGSWSAWRVEGLEPLFRLGFEAAGGQGPLPVVVSSVIIAASPSTTTSSTGRCTSLRNPR